MTAGCVSLALEPPWAKDRLILVCAHDSMRLCREGGHEPVPWQQAVFHLEGLAKRDTGSIRAFVAQARLASIPLTSLDDHKVVALILGRMRARDLVAVRVIHGGAGGEASPSVEQRRLVREIEKKVARTLSLQGQTYRLVAGVDWARLEDRSSYQVVGRREAAEVLDALAGPGGPASNAARMFVAAKRMLAPDWRLPDLPDGLVLLRKVVAPRAVSTSSEPALTPSQLKQMFKPSGVIEIELVDMEGKPIPDETWELLLPDGSRRSGQLDRDGSATITDVPESGCQVSFPRLDADAWAPCA
jgi:hypothetical protein